MIAGRVFDVSALTDLATGRTVYPRALIDAADRTGTLVIAVPVAALAVARGTRQDAASSIASTGCHRSSSTT